MVSLLSRVTARGTAVPVRDRRLLAHVKFQAVDQTDNGPAALADGTQVVEAPAVQQTSNTKEDQTLSDGTQEEG